MVYLHHANEGQEVPVETLVSIGLPTFNRPELLTRALESLTAQSWRNIEVILSDNASTDERVAQVIQTFAARDSRIRTHRQKENIGPLNNFFFVLSQARSSYFMWAADDDYFEPWFVERALKSLHRRPELMLATAEVQYEAPDGRALPFIAEGSAFRGIRHHSAVARLHYIVEHNFGNLVYGLFRKEALMQDGEVFWKKTGLQSLNEIPPLLYVAYKGEIEVAPEIGLHKQVPPSVLDQVEWELRGGRLPKRSRISGWRSALMTWNYHSKSLRHIEKALELLPLNPSEYKQLRKVVRKRLYWHFFYMLIGYKPRQRRDHQ